MTRRLTASRRNWIRHPGWLVLFLFVSVALSPVCEAKGEREFQTGQRAEANKNYEEALTEYQQALQSEPENAQYQIAIRRVRFQLGAQIVDQGNILREQGNLKEALAAYERAAAIDPSSPVAFQEIERTRALIEEQERPAGPEESTVLEEALGPPQLEPLSRAPINLRISNDSKVVLETIGKLAGINVLFEPDYTSKRITIELNNVTLEEALNQVGVLTKTFWKPITRNTILVVPDTTVKRREQEQQIIKTFYLSNTITPQELTEVVTAIRSLLETRRIQQINSLNAIIIRDTPDKVAIAEKIIRDVDKAKPEIVVEVLILEARGDRTRQLGLFPTSPAGPGIQIPVAATPRSATTTGTGTQTTTSTLPLNRLGTLSSADFSITLPGAQLNALLNDAHTKILQRPEIRASDGQKATLRVGDRVPIATGAFQPGIGGTVVSPLIQTQFQYTDVGVNLDITPKVHDNHEITLKVRIEVSAVTQQVNIGGIQQPIIGQRIIEHDIRLREGEISVLGGIFQRQNVETVSGIPGLAQIPLLRYIFSNVSTTIAENEVLLVLQPRVVRRLNITALNRKALDIGTEGDIRLRMPASLPQTEPETETEPSPGPGASLRFPEMNLAPQAGETFEVPLHIENASETAAVSLALSYDSQALKLLRTAKGDFLAKDNQPVAVVEREEEETGKTSITLSRPPGSPGVSGSGELAVFTFQALRPGAVHLGVMVGEERSASQQFSSLRGSQTSILIR